MWRAHPAHPNGPHILDHRTETSGPGVFLMDDNLHRRADVDPDAGSVSTVEPMTTKILDTSRGMGAVLAAPRDEREDILRGMIAPAEGMYRYFPGEVDLVAMHRVSFGFPLDRCEEEVLEALERMRAAEVWQRMSTALTRAVDVQRAATPDIEVPDVVVLLVLGDPEDQYFMGPLRGFSGNGSVSGYVQLTVWPTEENLARVEAAVVHELNHNLRYAPGGISWDPSTVVVGEQVISEGLADAFARQLYGHTGYTPLGLPHLDDDAVLAKVISGLQVTGMQNFTAWIHGDDSARRFDAHPVGLPTGAGYAAGNRLVDAYLATTGRTAAEALHVPSQDVINVALSRLH